MTASLHGESLDETFFALSDGIRRGMIDRLAQGDATVAELGKPYPVSAPAISKHLRVLERAGLLTQEKIGRSRRCRLRTEPLREALDWVARHRRFWEGSLDRLESFLRDLPIDAPPSADGSTPRT